MTKEIGRVFAKKKTSAASISKNGLLEPILAASQ